MKLIIDGRFQTDRADARRLVIINGERKWVTQNPFAYLLVLVQYRLLGKDRCPSTALPGAPGTFYANRIGLLRKQSGLIISYLRPIGYRLEMDPAGIIIEEKP